MHILVIAYEFPPSPSPQSLRWAYLARYLAEQGHRVSVLTIRLGGESEGLPTLPASISFHRTYAGPIRGGLAALRDLRHLRSKQEDARPAGADRLPPMATYSGQGWKQALSSTLQGAAAMTIFPDVRGEWLPWASHRLEEILERDTPDVVISSHEPATSLELGLLAKRRGLPWIADLGDPVLAPYTPPRWQKRAWRLERDVANLADHILVTTPAAAALLAERHERKERVTVVTQGHAADAAPSSSSDAPSTAAYDVQRLELLYTGSFYSFRRPEALLEVLQRFPEVRLNIASVTLPPSVLRFARELPNQIRLLGFLHHNRALELQRHADILVNIGNADPAQVPGKIYEYLGACRPILHLGNEDDAIAQFIAELRRGWSCVNRSDAIATQLAALISSKRDGKLSRGLDLGTNSVMQWHWKELALKIETIARSLCAKA
jgi:hypothetical protein